VTQFDLAIRGGTVVTASDEFRADIGIRQGRITTRPFISSSPIRRRWFSVRNCRRHGTSRPQIVEREATHRAISHAEIVGVPIMIVHVSGREAMEQVRWAQQRGLPVHAETCPQYITLTADDMKGLNMDMSGAKYVCSPPPRDKESQQAIWEGISRGVAALAW